ncbi:hypothetical protein [Saccharothrix sp. ALI-22-I]|uniref:hypothetical protein n=1 Tax=Saccharothrix sp. ALI-22-I TaxID=1933778 RepID=UPI0015C300D2|nr:hypothetical protein [Saccharothrix sp. ALI-22-I]
MPEQRHQVRGVRVEPGQLAGRGRVLFDPSPRIRQLFADQVDPVEGRYLDALCDALPEQDTDTILFGYTSMLALLAAQQAATFAEVRWRHSAGRPHSSDPDSRGGAGERLIAFLTAGLTHGLAK